MTTIHNPTGTSRIETNGADVNSDNPLPVVFSTVGTNVSNGLTDHKLIALATTNATVVKASVGRLMGGRVYNTSAAVKFFKLYAKATAPVVGADVPVMTLPIAPSGSLDIASVFGVFGKSCPTGIAYAITGAAADTDATAVAAGDVIVNLTYL